MNSGKAIGDALTSVDSRCKDYFETKIIRSAVTDVREFSNKFKEKTGKKLSHLSTAVKISYLMHACPKVQFEKGNENAHLV